MLEDAFCISKIVWKVAFHSSFIFAGFRKKKNVAHLQINK